MRREPITSRLDARLPQPQEWDQLIGWPQLPLIRSWYQRRQTAPEAEVEAIDQRLLSLLWPYRKDEPGPEVYIETCRGAIIRFDRRLHQYVIYLANGGTATASSLTTARALTVVPVEEDPEVMP